LKSFERRNPDTYKQHGDRIRLLPSLKTKDDDDDDRIETVEIDFA
jgi:hypothetical protein